MTRADTVTQLQLLARELLALSFRHCHHQGVAAEHKRAKTTGTALEIVASAEDVYALALLEEWARDGQRTLARARRFLALNLEPTP